MLNHLKQGKTLKMIWGRHFLGWRQGDNKCFSLCAGLVPCSPHLLWCLGSLILSVPATWSSRCFWTHQVNFILRSLQWLFPLPRNVRDLLLISTFAEMTISQPGLSQPPHLSLKCTLPMHVSALRHYTAQRHKYFYIHLQLCNERSGFAKFDHVFLTPGIASDLMRNYYSLDLLTHETLEKSADWNVILGIIQNWQIWKTVYLSSLITVYGSLAVAGIKLLMRNSSC